MEAGVVYMAPKTIKEEDMPTPELSFDDILKPQEEQKQTLDV